MTYHEIRRNMTNPNVSISTISRALRKSGRVKNVWQTKRPFVSSVNRRRRISWCREHVNWSLEDWKRVLWSDESPFVFRYQGRERVWKLTNEKFHPSLLRGTVKHDTKVMIWGCFAWNGVGNLYEVEGILEQKQYKKILQRQMLTSAQRLFPEGNFIFQQDNDPKHTSRSCQTYLRRKRVDVLNWPAQSPDLNPIENLWAILDKVMKDRRPQTKAELVHILRDGWNSLPIDLLHNLVGSMKSRCEAVLENHGYPTKY